VNRLKRLIYIKSILAFQHISRCYAEQNMTCTCWFKLLLRQGKAPTASMYDQLLAPPKTKGLSNHFFYLYLYKKSLFPVSLSNYNEFV